MIHESARKCISSPPKFKFRNSSPTGEPNLLIDHYDLYYPIKRKFTKEYITDNWDLSDANQSISS